MSKSQEDLNDLLLEKQPSRISNRARPNIDYNVLATGKATEMFVHEKLPAKKGQKLDNDVFKKCAEFWRRVHSSTQLKTLLRSPIATLAEEICIPQKNFRDLRYGSTAEMSSDISKFILNLTRAASTNADLYKSVVEFNIYVDSQYDELQLVNKDIITSSASQKPESNPR